MMIRAATTEEIAIPALRREHFSLHNHSNLECGGINTGKLPR